MTYINLYTVVNFRCLGWVWSGSSEGVSKNKESLPNFGRETPYKTGTSKIRRWKGDMWWVLEKLVLRLRGGCNWFRILCPVVNFGTNGTEPLGSTST
jgi:hypothetical protein